jgi:hypothetical protein
MEVGRKVEEERRMMDLRTVVIGCVTTEMKAG